MSIIAEAVLASRRILGWLETPRRPDDVDMRSVCTTAGVMMQARQGDDVVAARIRVAPVAVRCPRNYIAECKERPS
jgi:hypothetical protein